MNPSQQKLEHISTALLIPYARNSRTHSPEQVKQVANSIKEFGFTNPVLIDGDNGIIAGHGRVMAAQFLELEQVPCIRLAYLSEAQKRAYIIADNQLALNSGWDEDMLRAELHDLQAIEFDMDLLGFDVEFLEDMLEEKPPENTNDADEVPEPPVDPVSKLGDVWLLGKHRLMCSDSTSIDAVNQLMDGRKADVMLTDPPYGIKRDKGFQGFGGFGTPIARRQYADDWDNERPTKHCFDLLISKADVSIVFGGNFFADQLIQGKHWLVWDKKNTMPTFGDCELAWTNIDRKSVKLYQVTYNGLIGKEKERFHPTQKPVLLFHNILNDYTKPDFIVLDAFGGSGSTLIACEKTGRICYMMEISPAYVDVIVNRWQNYTGFKATLEATGKTFDELTEQLAKVSA